MELVTFVAYCLTIYVTFRTVRWLIGEIKIGKIEEKSILITGCDTGFGHDAAIRFSQLGLQVFAGCYLKKSLVYFESYSSNRGDIVPLHMDVSNEKSIKAAGIIVRSKLPDGRGTSFFVRLIYTTGTPACVLLIYISGTSLSVFLGLCGAHLYFMSRQVWAATPCVTCIFTFSTPAQVAHITGLWAIINNAGILFGIGPTQFLSKKHYQESLAVNLYGVVDVTREFLPLVQMERGRVVNTSSMLGRIGVPGLAPYNISKYGVEAFSDCLRREMHYFGVSVHIIEPGSFRTGMMDPVTYKQVVQRVYDQAPLAAQRLYGDDYVEQVAHQNHRVQNSASSSKTDLVVDAYVHATTSIAPNVRYAVGWTAKASLFMLNFPTIIMDLCLVKTYIKPSRLCKNNEENSNIPPSPEKQS